MNSRTLFPFGHRFAKVISFRVNLEFLPCKLKDHCSCVPQSETSNRCPPESASECFGYSSSSSSRHNNGMRDKPSAVLMIPVEGRLVPLCFDRWRYATQILYYTQTTGVKDGCLQTFVILMFGIRCGWNMGVCGGGLVKRRNGV